MPAPGMVEMRMAEPADKNAEARDTRVRAKMAASDQAPALSLR